MKSRWSLLWHCTLDANYLLPGNEKSPFFRYRLPYLPGNMGNARNYPYYPTLLPVSEHGNLRNTSSAVLVPHPAKGSPSNAKIETISNQRDCIYDKPLELCPQSFSMQVIRPKLSLKKRKYASSFCRIFSAKKKCKICFFCCL